jgi:hypothetical protein
VAVREGAGRGLTREGFESLLSMLDPDREKAGELYEGIRRRLVRLFEWRFCGVAHHVFQEVVRREAREHRALESDDRKSSNAPEDEPDARLDHLRDCLRTLDAEQCSLLLRYHQDDQRIRSRKDLCDELGIPMNALRIRVHRLRKKVEACVQEKLRN